MAKYIRSFKQCQKLLRNSKSILIFYSPTLYKPHTTELFKVWRSTMLLDIFTNIIARSMPASIFLLRAALPLWLSIVKLVLNKVQNTKSFIKYFFLKLSWTYHTCFIVLHDTQHFTNTTIKCIFQYWNERNQMLSTIRWRKICPKNQEKRFFFIRVSLVIKLSWSEYFSYYCIVIFFCFCRFRLSSWSGGTRNKIQ